MFFFTWIKLSYNTINIKHVFLCWHLCRCYLRTDRLWDKENFMYRQCLGFGIYYLFDSLPTRIGSKKKLKTSCTIFSTKINNIIELDEIDVDRKVTYLIVVDFEQSTGPVIDYRMMDWLILDQFVRRLHCYCNHVHAAIQRNVDAGSDYRLIDHAIVQLFRNGLTWLNTTQFTRISYHTIRFIWKKIKLKIITRHIEWILSKLRD